MEVVNSGQPLKIMIAVPSYRGFNVNNQTNSLLKLVTTNTDPKVQWIPVYSKACGVLPRVRNTLAAQACAEECTHLLFIDDDISFNHMDVFRMIGHDVGVVAAVPQKRIVKWSDPAKLAVAPDGLRVLPDVGLAIPPEPKAPMALTLIKTEVLKAIGELKNEDGSDAAPRFVYPLLGPKAHEFLRVYFGYQLHPIPEWSAEAEFAKEHLQHWDPKDLQSEDGEDHYFCRLAKRAGYDIFLDLEVELSHFEGNVEHDYSFKKLLASDLVTLQRQEAAE